MTTSAAPFPRLLVPYDGSEPAIAALNLAFAVARDGARVTIITIVDEMALIASTSTAMTAIDPTPLMEALDEQARTLLADAKTRAHAAGITAVFETIHEQPVQGILSASAAREADLVIMGTHARTGMARTFLGSTTAGVLRTSNVPVLTVRTSDPCSVTPFAAALVAIDDSEPADAAMAVAATLIRTTHTAITACYALDTDQLYNSAASFGFSAAMVASDLQTDGHAVLRAAFKRSGLPLTTPMDVVEGEPAPAIIACAAKEHATLIVAGTHGRRGLRRLILGSVAEKLVRTSDVPVLICPVPARPNAVPSSAPISPADRQAVPV